MLFLTYREQTLVVYEYIRIWQQHKDFCTPYMIRSMIVPRFCKLELACPSIFMKCILYQVIIMKILACTIMSGFCKSDHKCISPNVATAKNIRWCVYINSLASKDLSWTEFYYVCIYKGKWIVEHKMLQFKTSWYFNI